MSDESGKYRTERNDALKKLHVMKKIVDKHNISVNMDIFQSSMDKMSIEDGKVSGDVEYTPPKIESKRSSSNSSPKSNSGSSQRPTLDEVKTWSSEKINKNWETIKDIMKNG